MWYAIFATDSQHSLEKRRQNRSAHVSRLQQLKYAGRLMLAGPHPAIDNDDPGPAGFTGSLIIAEFDDFDAAQSWANLDPYLSAGIYKHIVIKPFKKILP